MRRYLATRLPGVPASRRPADESLERLTGIDDVRLFDEATREEAATNRLA